MRPSLDEFLNGQLRVVRPPGTVACYDTYGITLAGYLLEQLSGRSYANDVRARILEPLGMTNTFVETPTGPEGAAGPRERLARGYGLADAESGRRNDERTLFEIASISKSFTAAAILKLQEMGKLSTDDPTIACITRPVIYLGDLAAGEARDLHRRSLHLGRTELR